MQLKLNGKSIKTAQNTLFELLKEYEINTQSIVVAINTHIVKKEQWETYRLNEGDIIECLTFMGGG
ncbi:MAG: sulfur carrier protein ThiS [Helicobacter sp.]|nr:sulfur carrier protein ThiS [Helicobacter sp.]